MSDDPWAPQEGVVVTIKYGKGYDESWAVFRGNIAELRNTITDYFGIDRQWAESVTLHGLVNEATAIAHGTRSTVRTLGAREATPTEAAETQDAWDQAAKEKAEGKQPEADAEAEKLRAQIAACSDVEALKRLWAENREAFEDEALMAVWKARGKELSS